MQPGIYLHESQKHAKICYFSSFFLQESLRAERKFPLVCLVYRLLVNCGPLFEFADANVTHVIVTSYTMNSAGIIIC